MYDDVVEGRFQRITPDEIVDEMELFLTHVEDVYKRQDSFCMPVTTRRRIR